MVEELNNLLNLMLDICINKENNMKNYRQIYTIFNTFLVTCFTTLYSVPQRI